MDPVSVIVAAIAVGAATGLTETATSAVKDAYAALKRSISDRYDDIDLEPLERKPDSEAKRDSLREDLEAVGAADDYEIITAARQLIAVVQAQNNSLGRIAGIDLADVEAASVNISEVRATGDGVRVVGAKLTGDLNIKDVQAGPAEGQNLPFRAR